MGHDEDEEKAGRQKDEQDESGSMEYEEARQQRRMAVLEVEVHEKFVDKDEMGSGTAFRGTLKGKGSGGDRVGR